MTYTLDPRFEHHMVELPGGRMHYVMGGRGPAMVLLHGWGSTWYMWRKVMSRLADEYTVIVPDLPGLGDSSMPRRRLDGYDRKTVAGDIHDLVRALGLDAVHVMGHDMGGGVAYSYAALFEEEVRSLIFCEMALMGVSGDDGLEYFMDHRTELRLWHLSFHANNEVAELLIRGHEREYLRWFHRMQIYNIDGITDEDIDVYARAYAAPGALGLEYYRAFHQDAVDNKELSRSKLRIPVLAISGENSLRDICVTTMEAVATNVTGVIVPRCGHWLPEERPDELLEESLRFLRDL